jgi:uncharacterized protein YjiS (DUF1127 family)
MSVEQICRSAGPLPAAHPESSRPEPARPNWLARLLTDWQRRRDQIRQRRELLNLSDALLDDIGLSRYQVECLADLPERPRYLSR